MNKEMREYINSIVLECSFKGNLEPDALKFVAPRSLERATQMLEGKVDLYPNLLCQDMEKKLAVWFESKPDAREVFRRNLLSDSKKGTSDE